MAIKTKRAKKVYERILPIILPVLFILLWCVWTYRLSPDTILPSPIDVINRMGSMIRNGQLGEYTWITLKRALIGLLIGGGLGVLLGLINGIFRLADISLNTTIQILKNIPVLAFITLVIILFGIGEHVKVILIAFNVFFPIYISIYGGIKSIDNGLIEMGKSYGLSNFALFKEIILPGAFTYLFTGLKLSLRTMWLVLIAVELILPEDGIGYMAMTAIKSGQMDQLVLSAIIYALLSKLSEGIARVLERRLLSWQKVKEI